MITKYLWPPLKDSKPNFSGFVVIGAGLPRTGTLSTRDALSKILGGKCYHMYELHNSQDPNGEMQFWKRAMKGEVTKDQWIDFFQGRGYRAGVDAPISLFYKEIMEAYPDAKVVLTIRDPLSWYNSVKNTIYKRIKEIDFMTEVTLKILGIYSSISFTLEIGHHAKSNQQGFFNVIESGEEEAIKSFYEYIEDVKRHVPKEKLLIFDVKEGWGPLCKFLDLPVPNEPFPNVNDAASRKGNDLKLFLLSRLIFIGLPFIVALSAVIYQFCL